MIASSQAETADGFQTAEWDFKVADHRDELASAFRLIYRSYREAGLSELNPVAMRITPWHLVPSTEVLVAKLRGEVVGTVSLVADGQMGVPMQSTYPEVIQARRDAGQRFGEVSCLADRRRSFDRTLPLVVRLMSLLGQTARLRGIEWLLVVVHPRHVRFYERFIGFRPVADERSYSAVCGQPAVAMELNLKHLRTLHPASYQRFFGKPFPPEALRPHPMAETIRAMLNAATPILSTAAAC